jgi:hypothetical protein
VVDENGLYPLLNSTTGALATIGYEINGEKKWKINQKDAQPVFSVPAANNFRMRNRNLFIIQTEKHNIEIVFPVHMGGLGLCAS